MKGLVIGLLLVAALLLSGCGAAYWNAQAAAARADVAAADAARAAAYADVQRADIQAAARADARRDFYAFLLSVTQPGRAAADGGVSLAVGVGWPALLMAVVSVWAVAIWLYRRRVR